MVEKFNETSIINKRFNYDGKAIIKLNSFQKKLINRINTHIEDNFYISLLLIVHVNLKMTAY